MNWNEGPFKVLSFTFLLVLLPLMHLMGQDIKPASLPEIPVGYDAFRLWNLLPRQRIGVRAYMRSTYDRSGGSYDASNFLFMGKEDQNVTLDVKGEGTLWFFRANHWHGSPWHFSVDGHDNVVTETATSDPVNAVDRYKSSGFIPAGSFPKPLAWTWCDTKGADLIWVPMAFKKSLRIAYARTFYGTGYYIYDLYANPTRFSRPIPAWHIGNRPDQDVLDFLDSSGTDIAPKNIRKVDGTIRLGQKAKTVAVIRSAPAAIRAIKFWIPLDKSLQLERIRLRITWDHSKYCSVDAPLCLFFGAGTFYNRDKKEYLVKGLPMNIRYDYKNNRVELACYYPMPFFRSAKFELTGIDSGYARIRYEIRYEDRKGIDPRFSSYFHATYRDFPKPRYGQDMVWLDTRGIEGHQSWSGSFMGTSFIFSHNANLYTLEGDPRFFFDDSQTPQAYGTGTEEWAGGGDYWGGENMTLPLAGHPCGSRDQKTALNKKDLIQSAYRFLWADLMPFGNRAVIRFEHGENVSEEHYESLCYWYGLPAPSLVVTDSVNIGDTMDERRHGYAAHPGSKIDTIVSRYEWGANTYPAQAWGYDLKDNPDYKELIGKEIYPAHTAYGRTTRGVSEFDLKLRKDNLGVLLRRTLDYSYPDQTGEVWIADASGNTDEAGLKWEKAGIWYLAGANTYVFSKPKGELDPRSYVVKTSNRRFRDDEFLIPAALTQGCSKIRVRIRFIANRQELYPGRPFPKESAWSEIGYTAYCYVAPDFTIK